MNTPPPPNLEAVWFVTVDEQRATTNSSRINEVAGPKQKLCSAVDVSGGESKVRCCKERYCIRTQNVRSVNQDKLEVVRQEMESVNIDILGISELKWTRMGEFKSDNHYFNQKVLKIKLSYNKFIVQQCVYSIYHYFPSYNSKN